MPRNSNGVYTLPAGVNPVVTNTTIAVNWANSTLNDLASEVTNSLDRSGRGGMLAALRGIDGTVTLPAFSFTNEPSSGLYHSGAGVLNVGILGANVGSFQADGWHGGVSGYLPTAGGTMTGTITADVAEALRIVADVAYLSGFDGTGVTRSGYLIFNKTNGLVSLTAEASGFNVQLNTNGGGLILDSVGRVFGSNLHNNTNIPTGPTNQYIASGTYNPTVTNFSGVSGIGIIGPSKWSRVGNVVTVAVNFQGTVAAGAGTAAGVFVSLPIPSNFSVTYDAIGVMNNPGGLVSADAGTDSLQASWVAASSSSAAYTLVAQYEIL